MKKFLTVLALAVTSVSAYAADEVVAPKVVTTQTATTRPAPVVDRATSNEIRALGQLKDLTDVQKTDINKVLADALKTIKEKTLTADQVKALDEAAKAPPRFGPGTGPRTPKNPAPKATDANQP